MIKVASGPQVFDGAPEGALRGSPKPRSVSVPGRPSGVIPAFRPGLRATKDEEREWEEARQRALELEAREWEQALQQAKLRAAADEEREWQQSLARAKAQLQHEEREWKARITRARSSAPRRSLARPSPTYGSAPRLVPIAWP